MGTVEGEAGVEVAERGVGLGTGRGIESGTGIEVAGLGMEVVFEVPC